MQTDAPTTGLKACPFCGGEARLAELGEIGRYDGAMVCCTVCEAESPDQPLVTGRARANANAIEAWNIRTPALETQGAHEGVIEALREALIWADLKIRSYPGADQSDVEFIRKALSSGKTGSAGEGEGGDG